MFIYPVSMNAMRTLLLIFWCLVHLILSGCAHYHPKPISSQNVSDAFQARTLNDPGLLKFLAGHREKLNSRPERLWNLNALILASLYRHPDLGVAFAQWEVAKSRIVTAGERPNPGIGVGGQYNSLLEFYSPWTFGFIFDIPIETAGKRGKRIVLAQDLEKSAQLGIADTAWKIRDRVLTHFIEYHYALQSIAQIKAEQNILSHLTAMMERRLRAGESDQVELDSLRAVLLQKKLALVSAEGDLFAQRVALAQAMGFPARALKHVRFDFSGLDRLPSLKSLPPARVRREALLNRVDILQSLANYASSEATLRLEIAKQYPDLNLGPGYSWEGGDQVWTLGWFQSLPIANQNQGPIAEAKAKRKAAAAEFRSLQAKTLASLENAEASYRTARSRLAAANALLKGQKERQREEEELFSQGESDRIALLNAELITESVIGSRQMALESCQLALANLENVVQRPLWSGSLSPAFGRSTHSFP